MEGNLGTDLAGRVNGRQSGVTGSKKSAHLAALFQILLGSATQRRNL